MDLTGKMILAMPAMGDPRFDRAVILICAHSAEGAMGLIVNKPLTDLSFLDLLTQLKIDRTEDRRDIRLHFGGPVERGRGFVLHSPDYRGGPTTTQVGAHYGLTATLDVLEALARGKGPQRAVLALGYTGWGPGQLEAEIARNDWLTAEASEELVFGTENAAKWAGALAGLGVSALALSPTAGRA